MQVTLSTEKTVELAPLKLGQVRRMTELVDGGKGLDGTVNACVDSMRNADPSGAPVAQVWFEEEFTIGEMNEIFLKVMEISGLRMGEIKANG